MFLNKAVTQDYTDYSGINYNSGDGLLNVQNSPAYYGVNNYPIAIAPAPQQSVAINDELTPVVPIKNNTVNTTNPVVIPLLPSIVPKPRIINPLLQLNDIGAGQPINAKIIITDGAKPLHLANVAVNGSPKAQADLNGQVFLSVLTSDKITISYTGYDSQTIYAGALPKTVVLKLVVPNSNNNKPASSPKKHNWLLWFLGIGTAVVVINEAKKKPKSKEKLGNPNTVINAKI